MPRVNITRFFVTILAILLFAASLSYIFYSFDWLAIQEALRSLNFLKFLCAICLAHFMYIIIRTWRWRILIPHLKDNAVRFFDLYWVTAIVLSLSIVTPGGLGEALKIELFKRQAGLDRLLSLRGFVLERILDVVVIALIGGLGFLFDQRLRESFPKLQSAAVVFFLFGMAAFFLVIYGTSRQCIPQWLLWKNPGECADLNKLALVGLLSVLSWGLVGSAWWIALDAVGIFLSIPEILWLLSLVTLGTLASFVPGGIGVSEVLTSELLMGIGMSSVEAQLAAVILRVYAVLVIFYGFFHMVFWFLLKKFRLFCF